MRYVVIMAGGSGTRLWPLSRKGMPKQFLHLIEGKSLLRLVYERVQGMIPDENVLICTGVAYGDVVATELPELPRENILGEPVGRDSLNAVAWPAAILAARDPEAVVAFLSADQIIEPIDAFRDALDSAFAIAEADTSSLVTFGVVPTSAHTGMGYLHRGDPLPGHDDACQVREFKEKPSADVAERYVASGEYWWNSGLFVWRAETFLRQLEILLPQTHTAVRAMAEHPEMVAEIYPTLHKTSVDFGVMEPVSHGKGDAHVVAVQLPTTFHDVGGFVALAEQLASDEDDNVVEGKVAMLDARGNLILNRSAHQAVAVAGVEEMIIVVTDEITMICPLADAQRVKELVARTGDLLGAEYQ